MRHTGCLRRWRQIIYNIYNSRAINNSRLQYNYVIIMVHCSEYYINNHKDCCQNRPDGGIFHSNELSYIRRLYRAGISQRGVAHPPFSELWRRERCCCWMNNFFILNKVCF